MAEAHDWVYDKEKSMEMDGRFQVDRCAKCGCSRITDRAQMMTGNLEGYLVYKPMQWTWNPFKVLKAEPPCPAHW